MPPLTHSCYDIMEAREWAGSTMNSLFSNEQALKMDPTLDITLEKHQCMLQQPDPQQQQQIDLKSESKPRRASVLPHRLQQFNQIRRSFSVLDGGIHPHKKAQTTLTKQNDTNQHHDGSSQCHFASDLSHLVCLDDYSTNTTTPIVTCLTTGTQSAPVSPTDVSRRPSFSTRIIKKTFDMTSLLITTFDWQRKDNLDKEREALALWQHTFEQLLSSTSSSLASSTSSSIINISPPSSSTLSVNCTTTAPLTASLNLPSSPTRKHSKYKSWKYSQFIMMELLSTEENYLEDLYIIKTKFMDPLVKASQQRQPIINHRDIRTIFAFIPQLLLLSATFVRNLRVAIGISNQTCASTAVTVAAALDEDEDGSEGRSADGQYPCKIVGHVIYDLESSFDVFLYYALNFKKSRKCLAKLDCDALCHQLLLDSSIWRKETKRMNLSDFLITPIQRITRYSLILKDLQKHSPDSALLDRSIKCFSSLAFVMNELQ